MATKYGGCGTLDSALAYTVSGGATPTVTSSLYKASPGHSTVSFSVKPTTAGTWILYAVSIDGSTLIPLITARDCTANTIDSLNYQGAWAGGYKVKFTTTDAVSAGTVDVVVEGEGPSLGGWGVPNP